MAEACNNNQTDQSQERATDRGMLGLTSMISRMKQGVPLIRRIESCAPDRNEMTLCIAFLSEDLQIVKFVKSDDDSETEISVSALKLCNVEEVALSLADRFAVGLLLPKLELIIELIFASVDDAEIWYSVFKLLCSKPASGPESLSDVASEATDVQETVPSVDATQNMEVLELISDLQRQNEALKTTLLQYDDALVDMKRSLDLEKDARQAAAAENARLQNLLLVREETITELSLLVQTLIRQQTFVSRRDSVMTTIRPHEIMAPKLGLAKPIAASTAASSLGSFSETPDVLHTLSEQLGGLEERKRQLERMLESVTGL